MLCPDVIVHRCARVVRGEISRLTLDSDRFVEPFGLPRGFLNSTVTIVVARALRGTARFTMRTVDVPGDAFRPDAHRSAALRRPPVGRSSPGRSFLPSAVAYSRLVYFFARLVAAFVIVLLEVRDM